MVAQYERARSAVVSAYTVANELAIVRHMLRLASNGAYRRQLQETWGIEPRHLFAFS